MAIKTMLGKALVSHIPQDIILGLGTGTTVEACIKALATSDTRPKEYVYSSLRTQEFARQYGLQGVLMQDAMNIDLYIDGTDEIDEEFIALKGAGGAMTGEQLCAKMASSFWIIAQANKQVKRLGAKMPLPVEVIPWAQSQFSRFIVSIGGRPILRGAKSELGNPIIDCHGLSFAEPYKLASTIEAFPGVISHGLFVKTRPSKLLLGDESGSKWLENNNFTR